MSERGVRRESEQETLQRWHEPKPAPPLLPSLEDAPPEEPKSGELHNIVVVVTGGRNYHDWAKTYKVLDRVHRLRTIKALVSGMAPGLDSMAARWCEQRGVPLIAAPADWQRFGKAAGVLRNEAMLVDHVPHACVAFPGGRGTADMVRRVKARGIPLLLVED